jgi:hypothetical protein
LASFCLILSIPFCIFLRNEKHPSDFKFLKCNKYFTYIS